MKPYVSLILPCRNEELTIAKCIKQAKSALRSFSYEIIVADSSSDKSPLIATKAGARVIKHNQVGYGVACTIGAQAAKGKILILCDADGTYNLAESTALVRKIEQGSDLVLGNRLRGSMRNSAMPWLHRYIGNPVLSWLLDIMFHTGVSDSQSGFRAIKRSKYDALGLITKGMEFASEMLIRAAKQKFRIAQVPISYAPRRSPSKLRTISDGWRHLRFILMFSPTFVFLLPGILGMIVGIAGLLTNNEVLRIVATLITLLGYQVINLGLYARIYAIHTGFELEDKLIELIAAHISFERGLIIGFIMLLLASIIFYLSPDLLALTLLMLGFQTLFSSVFISMMLVEKRTD